MSPWKKHQENRRRRIKPFWGGTFGACSFRIKKEKIKTKSLCWVGQKKKEGMKKS